MQQTKFLQPYLPPSNENKYYIEFDDDYKYVVTKNSDSSIEILKPFNINYQIKNSKNKNCKRLKHYRHLLKLVGKSNYIKTQYKGSNKLFRLLKLDNSSIVFLINKHDTNLRIAVRLSNEERRRMNTTNETHYRSMMCEIPPCLMVLIPERKELKLYSYVENNNEGNKFIAWPYGNVFDTGVICVGSVDEAAQLLDYKNYITIDEITKSKVINIDLMLQMCYFSFFNTTFNTDLVRKNLETLNLNYQNRVNGNSNNAEIDPEKAARIMAALNNNN